MKATIETDDLRQRIIERRAIEAVNWGIPAVNYDRLFQAAREAGGDFNQIVYWSGPADWKNQTLTPNPDVISLIPFINTRDEGPVVLEIPPADDGVIHGTIFDCWQEPLEEVGLTGADQGRGGKFLVLPPGHCGATPAGYIVLRSRYYEGFALLRSVLSGERDADVAQAVAHAKRVKLYPLTQAAHPPPSIFVDVIHRVFDATIRYDGSFFRSLNRMVQTEPWSQRDTVMIDMLKSIGIEKGKRFKPEPAVQDILQRAAREARDWFTVRFETAFAPYFEDRQWVVVTGSDATDDAYAVDARALSYACGSAAAKRPGAGQFCLFSVRDRQGHALDGANAYRLTVPPGVPVDHYWSAVVYDRATHAFIPHVPHPGRSSQTPGIHRNADGSVDIYFGPRAPAGGESNWMPTSAGGAFEVCLRFSGPEPLRFDRTWKIPDIERTPT